MFKNEVKAEHCQDKVVLNSWVAKSSESLKEVVGNGYMATESRHEGQCTKFGESGSLA